LTSSNGTGDCSGRVPYLTDHLVVEDNCADMNLPTVALFYDGNYVDIAENCNAEAYNIKRHLEKYGFGVVLLHQLNDFPAWSNALANVDFLIMPKLESGDFMAGLNAAPAVKGLLTTYVTLNHGKVLWFGA
ncbi:hypothetical protein RZS08_22815, partial [Arthrospira platensis SPKY1]|nr:hypothetical protein [Arthrospira platensis SPKY1]